MCVIFDFDQTLVDSRALASIRKERNWQNVKANLDKVYWYPYIIEILNWLYYNKVPVVIFSNSPRNYVETIMAACLLPADLVIGYHDLPLGKHKPDPLGVDLISKRLNIDKSEMIGFGDHPHDIKAYKASEILSVACLWGTENEDQLLAAIPDVSLSTPFFLIPFLQEAFPKLPPSKEWNL